MRKTFLSIFGNWKRTILFWFVSLLLFICIEIWPVIPFGSIIFLVFLISMFFLLISAIYQFRQKNNSIAILNLVLFFISLSGIVLYIMELINSTTEIIEGF